MKRFFKILICLCLTVVFSISICGCRKNDDDNIFNFYDTKLELETMDTSTKSFLNNLHLNNASDQTLFAYVNTAKSCITSAIGFLQSWNTVVNSSSHIYNEEQLQEINNTIIQTVNSFSSEYEDEVFKFENTENRNSFYCLSKSDSDFFQLEYNKIKESCYAIQIVLSSSEENQYNVYQIYFDGYSGTFMIDNYCNSFITIFGSDTNSTNYPTSNGDLIYKF